MNRWYLRIDFMLIGGAIALLLVGYVFAFRQTLGAWSTQRHLLNTLAQNNTASIYLKGYGERKLINMTHIIEGYDVDTANFRSILINKISLIVERERVKLVSIPSSDTTFATNSILIQKLVLTGSFFDLTKVLYLIENTEGIGKLRTSKWILVESRSKEANSHINLEIWIFGRHKYHRKQ